MGLGQARLELQRLAIALDGLLVPALPFERVAQVQVDLRIIGFQGKGTPEAGDRLVRLAQFHESVAQVVVGVRVIRFKGERAPEAGRCLLGLPLSHQRVRQVVMGVGVVRVERE